MLFSLPIGMRIMEPRSTGEALIWFDARNPLYEALEARIGGSA